MRLQVSKDNLGWSDPGWALLLIGSFAALTFIYLRSLVSLMPGCVFHTLTGFPCPTCGSTRAFSALIDGELLSAWRLQPLFVSACIICALCALRAMIAKITDKRIFVQLTHQDRLFIRLALVVLIVIDWIYLLSAGR